MLPTNITLNALADRIEERSRYIELIKNRVSGTVKDLAHIKELVDADMIDRYLKVGDQIPSTLTYNNEVLDYPWDVVDIGYEYNEHDEYVPSITLMPHYCTPFAVVYDMQHRIVATEQTAQDGVYYYGNTGDTYTYLNLSTGDTIPYGSYTNVYKSSIKDTTGNISKYGYNRYRDSSVRQFINSDASLGQSWYDAPALGFVTPTNATTIPGFLQMLPEDFKSVIGKSRITRYNNSVTDGSTIDTMYDKFFLPSVDEMYGSGNGNEGHYFPYWKEATGYTAPNNASNPGRIFNDPKSTTAQYVRLGSANRSNSYNAWFCNATGYLGNGNASFSYRLAPACRIIKS